jgi:hypothetical protein
VTRRRVLLALLGFATLASASAVAQAPHRVHRVTLFGYFPSEDSMAQIRKLWLARFASTDSKRARSRRHLVDAKGVTDQIERKARGSWRRADVICVPGAEWTRMFMNHPGHSIVFLAGDPVRSGLVANFNRPAATSPARNHWLSSGKASRAREGLRPGGASPFHRGRTVDRFARRWRRRRIASA